MMLFTGKAAGLALLSLGLAARQAAAVENCLDLLSAVGTATGSTTTTVTLEADITCETHIEIATSQNVEITSAATGPHTLTVGSLFAGSTATESMGASSLIVNEGTLTLDGVNFATESLDGNRAIYNSGTLSVVDCEFNLFHDGGFIDEGGAIFSDSPESVDITGCTFQSNVALMSGGAVYAGGSETLTITASTFNQNEVGTGDLGTGAGGDVWTNRLVELTVVDSTFSGSTAEYGGAAIVCCGATITTSNFSSTDVASTDRHYGAVMVGGPEEEACPRELTVTGSTFSGCSVFGLGEGGALAIFDTTAQLTDCVFESSAGTAILFESSSAGGDHKLDMASCQFNENTNPAEAYASSISEQGAAVVVTNTGVSDGDVVEMGNFFNTFCFANDPYECEFVYDGAEILHDGEFKCHICDIDGVRQAADTEQASGTDDDLVVATDRSVDTDSSDEEDVILIGLAIAAGLLALIVIGGFTAWRCKKNPRSAGGATEAHPAPVAAEAAAPTVPPATESVPAATAPPATASIPATTGTARPAAQA